MTQTHTNPSDITTPRADERFPEASENWLSRALRAFGFRSGSTREELEIVLGDDNGVEAGFPPQVRQMLKNILDLSDRRVEDVMIPRSDIIAVRRDITLGELIKVFESAGHSRLVVYDGSLDQAIGMVHIRDLVSYMAERATTNGGEPERKLNLEAVDLTPKLSETRLIREMLFVPPTMSAFGLLTKMQATRIHLALVIDEYGGTDGLASIEDIVEEIVGDIEDEHDLDEPASIVAQTDGSFIVDARASLEDATAIIGPDFDVADEAKDVDTIGGYLVTRAGHVPLRGEIVPGPLGFRIEVLDADMRRVKRAKIYRAGEHWPDKAAALAQSRQDS